MQGLPIFAGSAQQGRRQQRQSLTAEPADDEEDQVHQPEDAPGSASVDPPVAEVWERDVALSVDLGQTDPDSPETEPDMPTLVPVGHVPQWTGGEAPEQAGKTWWDVDPRVRTAIETLCNETAEGMNRIAKQEGPELNWFNRFLR